MSEPRRTGVFLPRRELQSVRRLDELGLVDEETEIPRANIVVHRAAVALGLPDNAGSVDGGLYGCDMETGEVIAP